MEKEKISFEKIRIELSRDQMRRIMSGSGGPGCVVNVACRIPDEPNPNCCNGCLPYALGWVCL